MRRVDLEVDRLAADALVAASDPGGLALNLLLDLLEIAEPTARLVQELGPFILTGDAGRRMGDVDLVLARFVVPLAGDVYELENERSSGDDAAATREEVSADDILEDGRFSG